MSNVADSKPAKAFLKILEDNHNRWLTRSDICTELKAPRFTSYWSQALEGLVNEGLVERKEDVRGTFQTVYLYRLPEVQE